MPSFRTLTADEAYELGIFASEENFSAFRAAQTQQDRAILDFVDTWSLFIADPRARYTVFWEAIERATFSQITMPDQRSTNYVGGFHGDDSVVYTRNLYDVAANTPIELGPPAGPKHPLSPRVNGDWERQVEALQAQVLPTLEAGLEFLHDFTDEIPGHEFKGVDGHRIQVTPLTLHLFALKLATINQLTDSHEFFSGALRAVSPTLHERLGGGIADEFASSHFTDVGLPELVMSEMFGRSFAGFSPGSLSVLNPPKELLDLATRLLSVHPELADAVEQVQSCSAYVDLETEVGQLKGDLQNYHDALAKLGTDSLDVQRLVALIPNAEAQVALLATLGIDPNVDPNGKRPAHMTEAQWQASVNYVNNRDWLATQETIKSVATMAVVTFLGVFAGTNPVFLPMAVGLAVGSTYYGSTADIAHETERAHQAHAARAASDVDTGFTGTELATDADVSEAERRQAIATDKMPVDMALAATGFGTGAMLGKIAQTGPRILSNVVQGAGFGAASPALDERNWTRNPDGTMTIDPNALLWGAALGAASAGMGETLGVAVRAQPKAQIAMEAPVAEPPSPAPATVQPKRLTTGVVGEDVELAPWAEPWTEKNPESPDAWEAQRAWHRQRGDAEFIVSGKAGDALPVRTVHGSSINYELKARNQVEVNAQLAVDVGALRSGSYGRIVIKDSQDPTTVLLITYHNGHLILSDYGPVYVSGQKPTSRFALRIQNDSSGRIVKPSEFSSDGIGYVAYIVQEGQGKLTIATDVNALPRVGLPTTGEPIASFDFDVGYSAGETIVPGIADRGYEAPDPPNLRPAPAANPPTAARRTSGVVPVDRSKPLPRPDEFKIFRPTYNYSPEMVVQNGETFFVNPARIPDTGVRLVDEVGSVWGELRRQPDGRPVFVRTTGSGKTYLLNDGTYQNGFGWGTHGVDYRNIAFNVLASEPTPSPSPPQSKPPVPPVRSPVVDNDDVGARFPSARPGPKPLTITVSERRVSISAEELATLQRKEVPKIEIKRAPTALESLAMTAGLRGPLKPLGSVTCDEAGNFFWQATGGSVVPVVLGAPMNAGETVLFFETPSLAERPQAEAGFTTFVRATSSGDYVTKYFTPSRFASTPQAFKTMLEGYIIDVQANGLDLARNNAVARQALDIYHRPAGNANVSENARALLWLCLNGTSPTGEQVHRAIAGDAMRAEIRKDLGI